MLQNSNQAAVDGLKAKIQLTHEKDYQKVLSTLNQGFIELSVSAQTPLTKKYEVKLTEIVVQQDFVLDSLKHDLWNAGLTLSLRHTVHHLPEKETSCTVAFKEAIFKDFISLHGQPLAPLDQNPYYEIKETEEKLSVESMEHILSGITIDANQIYPSKLLNFVTKKYYIREGIRCIGSFINLRHSYQWEGHILEIDKCKFPHGEGFFLRFPPDEDVIFKILNFLQSNEIHYAINLTSKTALFFQGLKLFSNEHIKFSPTLHATASSNSAQNLKLQTKDTPSPSTSAAAVIPELVSPMQTSIMVPPNVVPDFQLTDSLIGDTPDYFAQFLQETIDKRNKVKRIKETPKKKRGRKSLLEKLIANANDQGHIEIAPEPQAETGLPEPLLVTLAELQNEAKKRKITDSDASPSSSTSSLFIRNNNEPLKQLPQHENQTSPLRQPTPATNTISKEILPALVETYHKKKSCEASARYRKRKMEEMDRLKTTVEELKEKNHVLERELKRYIERYGKLSQ